MSRIVTQFKSSIAHHRNYQLPGKMLAIYKKS